MCYTAAENLVEQEAEPGRVDMAACLACFRLTRLRQRVQFDLCWHVC